MICPKCEFKNILIATIFLPIIIFAQNGKLHGKVVDKVTNEPLIGATVLLENTENLGDQTNKYGEYKINYIPPGVYNIKVSFIGYEPSVATNVKIIKNKTITRSFALSYYKRKK